MGRPSSAVPYCIIGKVSWGVVQALKVPEAAAHRYVGQHGWMVLIRDSDMAVADEQSADLRLLQSNPRRQADGDDGTD